MDFRQTIQPSTSRPAASAPAPTASAHKEERASASNKNSKPKGFQWLRLLSLILLVGIAVLLLGVIIISMRNNAGDDESKFVDKSKYQAVFLNNGQVYFGNVKVLNSNYVRMTNIYYLTQGSTGSGSSSSANNNYSLVKLGCQQIHDPLDEMVINREQVTFWENLNASGKVVSSIKQFQQQNPSGPDCSQVSNQTQASNSSTSAQGTNNSSSSSSSSGR